MYKISNHIINRKFIEYYLLTFILILGVFVRLYKIDNPIADWHSWRQADTASVSRIYVDEGVNILTPRYYDISSIQSGKMNPKGYRFVEFPFYNLIHASAFEFFGGFNLELWGRLISVFASIASACFIYLIGKKYLGATGGILSAFFFLFTPFNIYFTRVILPEPFGVFVMLAGIWSYIKYIEKRSFLSLVLSAVLLAMALLIKPFFAFYFLPLLYITNKKIGIKKIFKNRKLTFKFVIFGLITLMPFVFWRAWENKYPEGIPFFEWAFNGDYIRFRPAFWRWIFGERLGSLILGTWGLIPFVFGLIRPKEISLFIKYSIAGMLLYVVVVATANVRHDYYQILAMPAISWVLASGATYLWNNEVFNKIASRTLLVFSVFMMLFIGWLGIRDFYQINHPEIVEVGARIDEITPKDSLVVAPYNGDTAFLYHTKRFGWPAVDNSIENIVAQGADYYVSTDLSSKDTMAFQMRYETIEKTNQYIILDLHRVKGLNK